MLVADDVGAFTVAEPGAVPRRDGGAWGYDWIDAPPPRRSWLHRVCAWLCGKGWAG
jgi:hypothetical protein